MADEPEDLVLRLLREIRKARDTDSATLGEITQKLDHLTNKVDDLHTISTHTLGVAANAHVRYEALEKRVEQLTKRIERLESR